MRRTAVMIACLGLLVPPPAVTARAQTGAPARCGDGQRRWLVLLNLTRSTVYRFAERAPGASGWGPDRLGSVAVPPGQRVKVSMSDDGCRCTADVRVTFEPNGRPDLVYSNLRYCGEEVTLYVD